MLMLAGGAAPASGAPACEQDPPKTRTLLQGLGTLESVIVDADGRPFFTDDDSLLRLDPPESSRGIWLR